LAIHERKSREPNRRLFAAEDLLVQIKVMNRGPEQLSYASYIDLYALIIDGCDPRACNDASFFGHGTLSR
jgi:hypothetical protein